MRPELHEYLDGELPREALGEAAQAELREWDALDGALDALRAQSAPPWLATRIMHALPRHAPRPGWRRALDWLLRPHSVRLRPAALLAPAAAILIAVIALPDTRPGTEPLTPQLTATPAAGEAEIYVQFTLDARDAAAVALAGDFNGWDPSEHALRDPDGDGIWSAMFPLPTGLHKYMFVVDGVEWVSDPRAERHVDDGFGMRNALIAVGPVGEAAGS